MNYSKIIVFGSLFLCNVALSVEPQELLTQFKAMAEKEYNNETDRLEAKHKQLEEEDIKYAVEAWRHEKSNIKAKKARINVINHRRATPIRLDHIKVLYIDQEGKHHRVYLQLENSFLGARNFTYVESIINEELEELVAELSHDKQPKVTVYKSRKHREEKGWFFTNIIRDLHSVCIDYSGGKVIASRADWINRLSQVQNQKPV